MTSAGMPWPPPRAKSRPIGRPPRYDPEDPTGWWRLAGMVLMGGTWLACIVGLVLLVLAWYGVI